MVARKRAHLDGNDFSLALRKLLSGIDSNRSAEMDWGMMNDFAADGHLLSHFRRELIRISLSVRFK